MAFEPKRASDLLSSVLQSVQSKSSRGAFQRAFDDALVDTQVLDTLDCPVDGSQPIDRGIRDRSGPCEVLGFRGGVLQVEVSSAPLFAELSTFHKETLRLAMNERLDDQAVAKIVFRMSGTARA